MACDPKRKDGSYLDGTIMSIARLDACVAPVVLYLVVRDNNGGNGQKGYGHIYVRMMKTATTQSSGSIRKLVKHWSREKVTLGKNELHSGERIDIVMGMAGSTTNMSTIPSVKRTFISVEKGGFERMWLTRFEL